MLSLRRSQGAAAGRDGEAVREGGIVGMRESARDSVPRAPVCVCVCVCERASERARHIVRVMKNDTHRAGVGGFGVVRVSNVPCIGLFIGLFKGLF
jgi:hypothetical protein